MKLFSKIIYGLFKFLYPYKVYGKENIPEGGAVLICNHFSFVDGLYILDITDRKCSMVCKKEAFKKGLVGNLLRDLGAVPIDRETPNITELLTCIKVLKSDRKLLIFPEGTRNKTKTTNFQPIKSGSGMFAVKAKKPIVPIMQQGKARLFKKQKLLVGTPFELSEFYNKKLEKTDTEIIDKIIFDKMIAVQKDLNIILTKKKKK